MSRISPEKLKSADHMGIKAIVEALGRAWGQTILEQKYEHFERAIYTTQQKSDETNDSYIARHDVHFEELLLQNTSFEELRSYVLLRQSQLSSEDKKKILLEHNGVLNYEKVKNSIRLLGYKFFSEMQGSTSTSQNRTYDVHQAEEEIPEAEYKPDQAFSTTTTSTELGYEAEVMCVCLPRSSECTR